MRDGVQRGPGGRAHLALEAGQQRHHHVHAERLLRPERAHYAVVQRLAYLEDIILWWVYSRGIVIIATLARSMVTVVLVFMCDTTQKNNNINETIRIKKRSNFCVHTQLKKKNILQNWINFRHLHIFYQ